MTRGGMDDLLEGQRLHNTHLNAYALALSSKIKLSKANLKRFLYVSSDYDLFVRHASIYFRWANGLINKKDVKADVTN
ncbi:hypothetical protein KSP40_PGU013643 [Platanthera guangdongensis]|uniref:Uncharacterized protein n=1 Tax=Platanthera guangdongensis TaxID=2320717 RepID=A0ABR2MXC2_9ASPA